MMNRILVSFLVTWLLTVVVAASAAERPPFPNHRFSTGTGATRHLVVADFNEDGAPDVGVATDPL